MSLFKLFLSGLLVAGGLVLGAFTLHGYLDPQWAQKQAQVQVQAAKVKPPAPGTASINAFEDRSRLVTRNEPAAPEVKVPPFGPAVVKASAGPDAVDAKAAQKPAPRKKDAERPAAADKAKASPPPQPQPQQASFDWPWLKQLFGSK